MNTRGRYWVEAESNIIEANKIGSLSDLSFWANLLAAIANATMASAPDGVMQEVEAIAEGKAAHSI